MTKTKITLAAALLAATSSVALAQGYYGSNPESVRVQQHRNVRHQPAPPLQQRNVALPTEGRSAAGPFWYNWSGPTSGGM